MCSVREFSGCHFGPFNVFSFLRVSGLFSLGACRRVRFRAFGVWLLSGVVDVFIFVRFSICGRF